MCILNAQGITVEPQKFDHFPKDDAPNYCYSFGFVDNSEYKNVFNGRQ